MIATLEAPQQESSEDKYDREQREFLSGMPLIPPFKILRPNKQLGGEDPDIDYIVDDSGHYLLAMHDIITGGIDSWDASTKNQVARWIQTPLGGYRPLPAARKFHRSSARFRHALGGNRCLGPDTLIESPDGPPRRVSDIEGPHRVWAWDGKKKVAADAGKPFIKSAELAYRIKMTSGKWFDCTGGHQVLTTRGYEKISDVLVNGPRSQRETVSPDGDLIQSWSCIGGHDIWDFEVPIFSNYVTAGVVHHNSSKSHSLAVEVMWRAIGMHPFHPQPNPKPPIIWYCTTVLEKMADVTWAKLDPQRNGLLLGLDTLGYKFDIVWRSKQYNQPHILKVFWPNKGGVAEIIFKSYDQERESFQGSEVDFVAFDEQFPQDIFIESTSRIGPGKACEFASAFTPLIPDNWLENRTHWEIPEQDEVFHFELDDQRLDWGGFVDAKLISETIENWPVEVRDTRRFGKWGAFIGAIFQSFAKEIHVVSEAREREIFWQGRPTPNGDIRPVGVIDWGGSNPFYFMWAARIPHLDDDWYIFDELFWDYRTRGMCRLEALATQILSRTKDNWKTVLWNVWADHDPVNVGEFRHCGISSKPATKVGNNEEISRAGIEQIQTQLMPRTYLVDKNWPKGRPRLHIAERCKELIREMPLYRWSDSVGEKNARNVPVKKDDHAVDALRYLCSSERPVLPGYGQQRRIQCDRVRESRQLVY